MNTPDQNHHALATLAWTCEHDLLTPRTDRALDALRLALIAALNVELEAREIYCAKQPNERTLADRHAVELATEKTLILLNAFQDFTERFTA